METSAKDFPNPKLTRSDANGSGAQRVLPFEGAIEKIPRRAQPFLKWAGGKSQLLSQLDEFFPQAFDRYVEPFLGGGAVFYHLRARFPDMPAYLCDNNHELINCYQIVRDKPEDLMALLDGHAKRFEADRKIYYYEVREQHRLKEPVRRAARMIFLNKTCFNGLWRVNSTGEFNVPIGSGRSAKVYDRENLLGASLALAGAELVSQDFRKTLALTRSGDFVYIDPPYDPVSKTAYFTAYTKDNFGANEQRELAHLFHRAALGGANLMLSNSDTPLIRGLYKRYKMHFVQARRMINSQGTGRGVVPELVVLVYTNEQVMKMVTTSVRAWLLQNNYSDVAERIDQILLKWERDGKKTRRNWWDVLAGSEAGLPTTIEGYTFPVLRAARIRKGLPVTENCLCRNESEEIPPIIEQTRWKKAKRTRVRLK